MENATPQTNRCSDVVRLDLATNRRTVVAHAQTFAVSANGNRVALEEVEPDIACTDTTKFVVGVNVVRDVSSGRQSAIVGDFEGSIAMSPGGHVLLATHCATDDYNEDCPATLESAAVPDSLGAPVTLHDVNTHGSFTSLVARNDGLYAIVDTMQRDCGCAGAPQDRTDSAVSVRRLSWSALAGTGATVFTVHGPLQLDGLAVTPNGLYATGLASVKADRAVFHLGANGAQLLRLVPDPEAAFDFLGTIDAFAG
jgi:hypothetical protein